MAMAIGCGKVTPLMEGTDMELAVSLAKIDPGQSVDAVRMMRGTNIRFLEVAERDFRRTPADLREYAAAFAEAGVSVRTVHAAYGGDVDLSSGDAGVADAGVASASAAVRLAADLGAAIVVMHASFEPIRDAERSVRIAQAKLSIQHVCEFAREADVRIAVELLPRTCIGRTPEELLALLADLDPQVVGICLDTNHLMDLHARLPDVVRMLAPRLIALHCSDYDGVDEKHWLPMRGVVGWRGFLQALGEICFDGPLNYEVTFEKGMPVRDRIVAVDANFAELMQVLQ